MPALNTWLWAAGIVCVFGSSAAVVVAEYLRRAIDKHERGA
ncbi:MAG: hypothetical protein AB7G17_14505 [Phycisphaerales bacterium]